MRSFIAASIGAIVGFAVVFALAVADSDEFPVGDIAFVLFAIGWCLEALAIVILCMYRVSPWIARALLDEWESERIRKAGAKNRRTVEVVCSIGIVLRRGMQTFDSGHLTWASALALILAALPFLLPPPNEKRPNKSPEPTA
jgi:hypothetical protein